MTEATATERESPERASDVAGREGEGEHPFQSLLLAALLTRREERTEEIHPLMLALLARRRGERGEDFHPLLLATLLGRREGRGEEIHPMVLAALTRRRQEHDGAEEMNPVLFAMLAGQQR